MIITEDWVFFYGGEDLYSNFHKAPYALHGVEFQTVEQGFQWEKAVTFGDRACAASILETDDPGEAKYLGKRVLKGYNDDVWAAKRYMAMFTHVYHKFAQNLTLQRDLLQHYIAGRKFCEASQRDEIWGCGLWANEAAKTDPAQWPGENELGRVLFAVAQRLVNESSWLQQGWTIEDLDAIVISKKELDDEEYD